MAVLIFIPILGLLVMLQTAVFSNLQVLYGTVDLVFLTIVAWSLQEKVRNAWIWAALGGLLVSLVSALPFFSYLIGYIFVAIFAGSLKRRIWQIPALAMFFMTAVGTILVQFLSLGVLLFMGTRLEWLDTINLVILPSILLNLLLALPVYLLITDLANWVYPTESE